MVWQGDVFSEYGTYGIIRCHYCFSGDNTVYPGLKRNKRHEE